MIGTIFLPRYSESIQYNGPIVYSNEKKPPIIHFPPPPNLSNKDAHNKLSLPNQPVKYIPLPHHDLPVLIYQSEKQPPIHVVHPPMTKGKINQPAQKQTYSQSKISFSSDQIYEFPMSYVKSKESSSLPNHQKVSQPNLRPMNHGKGSTSIKPDKKIEIRKTHFMHLHHLENLITQTFLHTSHT
ncbi:unnamed protein product [Lepeophtheirus salmonis]|uniref:(salmon louse) hypothetical protein n=1 Tax=Lepeophtheirus salmonis TaxID=72036 RepID=A0A817FA59_LEPSM|nr:unnamed protein product [Lepeophtheirus salmonis]CAG9475355.1 unnamed protein product [Lepeophtheirus salmonis]